MTSCEGVGDVTHPEEEGTTDEPRQNFLNLRLGFGNLRPGLCLGRAIYESVLLPEIVNTISTMIYM